MTDENKSDTDERPESPQGSEGMASSDSTREAASPAATEGPDASGLSEEQLKASEEEIRQELGIGGGADSGEEDIESLLAAATAEDADLTKQLSALAEPAPQASAAPTAEASGGPAATGGAGVLGQNLQLLRDVHMKVKVELGRGHMYLKDILRLGQGSVVELERLAGDPLDIYVNDKVIARGEVLVLNENFCIRITEIHDPADVLKNAT